MNYNWIKIVLIYMIGLSFNYLFNCWAFGEQFDPDEDFCDNPSIDSGVVADDGETYLFKGLYYWKIRPLNTDSGIVGYANPIVNKWPQISVNIRIAFTILIENELLTVLVVKDHWYSYRKGRQHKDGKISIWDGFNELKITSAFTPTYGGPQVYILHSDNNYYTLFDFSDINKPKQIRSGKATIRVNYLLFTEENTKTIPGDTIKSLLNVRAGLTYKDQMFLVSKDNFCVISLKDSFERECNPQPISIILGCPLDLSKRPTTKAPITTTMTREPLTSITKITIGTTGGKETTFLNSSLEVNTHPNWEKGEKNDSESNDTIRGITILGHELEEEDSVTNSTVDQSAGHLSVIQEKNRQNSQFWIIFFIFAFILVFICALIMIAILSKVQTPKQKGDVYNID